MDNLYTIDPVDVKRGMKAFKINEPRDGMYNTATFLVKHFWGMPSEMADGLGVLLLTWNISFYRFGYPDFALLETTLRTNMSILNEFRKRKIDSLSQCDYPHIEVLFLNFNNALKSAYGKNKGRRSPVAVAKALHLLAPDFFPLWDEKIAKEYECYYAEKPEKKYLSFMCITKGLAACINGKISNSRVNLVKAIDEYNYAKFTKRWL